VPPFFDVARVLPPTINPVARTMRRIVSGDATGRPDWIRSIENGHDEGLFGPGSAPWIVHGSLTTLIGGVRALLLQALHPAARAGVQEHSRFRADALGRLAGTSRWLVTLTFGDSLAVERESARVRRMHDRVRGHWADPDVGLRPYAANDPHLLRWVHLAFTDSFLRTYQIWGDEIPGGPDAYVREWGRAAEPLGLVDPPTSTAELHEQIAAYDPELSGGEEAREVVRFILNPPLPLIARPAYAILAAAAITTMEPKHRELLGLPSPPRRATQAAAGALLGGLRLALGDRSPSERAAQRRVSRLES
jgi:uncharacterized protein (DUF2236 family)